MSVRKILFIAGDFVEDYEIVVPYHGKKSGEQIATAIYDVEGYQSYTEKKGHNLYRRKTGWLRRPAHTRWPRTRTVQHACRRSGTGPHVCEDRQTDCRSMPRRSAPCSCGRHSGKKDCGLSCLARFGLNDRMDFYPDQLSEGQKQRMAIARAMAMTPALILFDEPTSALDPALVQEVQSVMRDLSAEGMTMVIVTHDMRSVRKLQQRFIPAKTAVS